MNGFIPQAFIDDLLNRIDIVDVVSSRIQLKKAGKNFSACCPFHQEKTPSFTVAPDKQFYYCFGCGATGNAIKFVMEYDHLDFQQTIENLSKQVGVDVVYETHGANKVAFTKDMDSPLHELLKQAAEYYQQALRHHPHKQVAVEYFQNRGLTGIIARDFGLGYAPPGWDNLIKEFNADDQKQKALIDAGLVIENAETGRRYDRFRDRIMFPIRDMRGRVIAFGGRVLGEDKPKYLNSPETPVFHKSETLYGLYEARQNNRHLDEIIVLEGYMDVIALAQYGLKNAVATLGTATTEEHIKKLFRIVSNILFCFDGDAAGKKAAWRALESALPYLQDGRRVSFLFLPEGEDPDSLVRSEGGDAFKARINQHSQSLAEYFFDHLTQETQPNTLEGKAALANTASALINKIPKNGLQALMFNQLTELTGLEAEQLITFSNHAESRSYPEQTLNAEQQNTKPFVKYDKKRLHVSTPTMRALSYLLQQPSFISLLDFEFIPENNHSAYLLKKTIEILKSEPHLTSYQLIGKLISFDKHNLINALMNKEQLIGKEESLKKEFLDSLVALKLQQDKQQRTQELDELLNKDHTTLTKEEKAKLVQLLSYKG